MCAAAAVPCVLPSLMPLLGVRCASITNHVLLTFLVPPHFADVPHHQQDNTVSTFCLARLEKSRWVHIFC
jgi:hypothetical protein